MEDRIPSDPPILTLEETKRIRHELVESNARMKRESLARYRSMVGAKLDSLMEDRKYCERCLLDQDQERDVRLVAIWTLADHWKVGPELAGVLRYMVKYDNDLEIRRYSVLELSCVLSGSRDNHMVQFLASIVIDPNEAKELRIAAYCGLFRIMGADYEKTPIENKLQFPEEVDWSFVESFL